MSYRVYFFIVGLFLSSCSSLNFVAGKNISQKISAQKKSDDLVEVDSRADFYFWGLLPKNSIVNLEDHLYKLGIENSSYLSIEQKIGVKSFLFTLLTLGVYCPVDYKISFLTHKDVKK